jgi:peptide deformylase
MAVRKIAFVGEPVLRQKAQKVRHVDKSIEKLVDDMAQTMREANGLGLAANQVGVLQRVVVIELPYDEEDPQSGKLYGLINPEIVQASEELVSIEEGCLSIPYYYGAVTRPDAVVVRARDRKWRELKIKATGMLARALQHEIDHLNGVLFIDRMESMDKLRYVPAKSEAEHEVEAFKEAEARHDASVGAEPARLAMTA